MTVPNFFTALRIALVPVFGWMWFSGHHTEALWIFGIASVTDLLDGFLARSLDQRSRLGAILDPAADKLMLLVSFLVAASLRVIPWWLAALVIGRDVLLSTGAALFAFRFPGRHDPDRWRPTRLGKYSTFYQLATIGLGLVARATGSTRLVPWVGALTLVTAALTTLSLVQYVGRALVPSLAASPALPAATPRPTPGGPS